MSERLQFKGTRNYIASPELQEIVNVACDLERPLLIRGEPGTGKTILAKAVAESLGLPLLTWTVRTPEQRQRAARYADQMIFEGFIPGT